MNKTNPASQSPLPKRIKICEIKTDFVNNELLKQLGTKIDELEQKVLKKVDDIHMEMKNLFIKKLYLTETKLEALQELCHMIVNKLEQIQDTRDVAKGDGGNHVLVSGVRTVRAELGLDNFPQIITLNSEKDYPKGCWLGDEKRQEFRVRCKLSSLTLMSINDNCHTPEKMALTLMDHLFDKDVMAVSNLSGKSKHSKKQLDPLMIYGIHCHLVHKFNINNSEWHRIKQNMDSKCRSLWRKKMKLVKADKQGYEQQKSPSTVQPSSSIQLTDPELHGAPISNIITPVHFVQTAHELSHLKGISVMTAQQVFQGSPSFLKIPESNTPPSSTSLHEANASFVPDLSANNSCEQHTAEAKTEAPPASERPHLQTEPVLSDRATHIHVLEEQDGADFVTLSSEATINP